MWPLAGAERARSTSRPYIPDMRGGASRRIGRGHLQGCLKANGIGRHTVSVVGRFLEQPAAPQVPPPPRSVQASAQSITGAWRTQASSVTTSLRSIGWRPPFRRSPPATERDQWTSPPVTAGLASDTGAAVLAPAAGLHARGGARPPGTTSLAQRAFVLRGVVLPRGVDAGVGIVSPPRARAAAAPRRQRPVVVAPSQRRRRVRHAVPGRGGNAATGAAIAAPPCVSRARTGRASRRPVRLPPADARARWLVGAVGAVGVSHDLRHGRDREEIEDALLERLGPSLADAFRALVRTCEGFISSAEFGKRSGRPWRAVRRGRWRLSTRRSASRGAVTSHSANSALRVHSCGSPRSPAPERRGQFGLPPPARCYFRRRSATPPAGTGAWAHRRWPPLGLSRSLAGRCRPGKTVPSPAMSTASAWYRCGPGSTPAHPVRRAACTTGPNP